MAHANAAATVVMQAAGGAAGTPPLLATPVGDPPVPWFTSWASKNELSEFARLVVDSDLSTFVEGSETPLTLFAPTNQVLRAMAHKLPTDPQLLRELACVHITLGSLRCATPL